MLGVKAPYFVQFNVGVLGSVHGSAGNPPVSTGKTRGQVCASPGIVPLPRAARLSDDFAVSWLPEPDRRRLVAKHDGVIPTPHYCAGAARHLSDGYQMTW
jgi:hypothetical protein